MLGFIVSNDPVMGNLLRHALADNGFACPAANLSSSESAETVLAALAEPPDVILFVLHADADSCESLITELRAKSRAYLVVVGPRDLQFILRSIRAGGDDYLDEGCDLARELPEILMRGKAALQLRGTSARLTTVLGAGGGNGCTTIAVNLAVLLAQKRERTVLLDFDFGGGSAASLLNLRPRHTCGDLIRNIESLDQKMFEQCLAKHETGAEVLAASENFEDAEFLKPETVARICRLASLHAPHVVVDLKEFWKKTYTNLLQESSKILVVTRLDFPAITNANRVLEHLEHIGIERSRVSLIVNQTGQPKELSLVDVACALKLKISYGIPDDRKTMNACTNCGNPAVCEVPQSKCARTIAQIANEIDDHVATNSATASKSSLMERAAPLLGKLMQAINVRLEALVPKPIL